MLQVGNGGLTETQDLSHFSMWCMLAAPLLAGNDLTKMTPYVLSVLAHDELIAINQDLLVSQASDIDDSSTSGFFGLNARTVSGCADPHQCPLESVA